MSNSTRTSSSVPVKLTITATAGLLVFFFILLVDHHEEFDLPIYVPLGVAAIFSGATAYWLLTTRYYRLAHLSLLILAGNAWAGGTLYGEVSTSDSHWLRILAQFGSPDLAWPLTFCYLGAIAADVVKSTGVLDRFFRVNSLRHIYDVLPSFRDSSRSTVEIERAKAERLREENNQRMLKMIEQRGLPTQDDSSLTSTQSAGTFTGNFRRTHDQGGHTPSSAHDEVPE